MRITWRQVAVDGLEAARRQIAADNPSAADRVFERILSAVSRLSDMPHLGRAGRVPGTRELVVAGTPFIVAYTASEKEVSIVAVIHGARRWPAAF